MPLSEYWRREKSAYLPLEIAMTLRQQTQLLRALGEERSMVIKANTDPNALGVSTVAGNPVVLSTSLFSALEAPIDPEAMDLITAVTLHEFGHLKYSPSEIRNRRLGVSSGASTRGLVRRYGRYGQRMYGSNRAYTRPTDPETKSVVLAYEERRVHNELRRDKRWQFVHAYLSVLEAFVRSPKVKDRIVDLVNNRLCIESLAMAYHTDTPGAVLSDLAQQGLDVLKKYYTSYGRSKGNPVHATNAVYRLKQIGISGTLKDTPDPNKEKSVVIKVPGLQAGMSSGDPYIQTQDPDLGDEADVTFEIDSDDPDAEQTPSDDETSNEDQEEEGSGTQDEEKNDGDEDGSGEEQGEDALTNLLREVFTGNADEFVDDATLKKVQTMLEYEADNVDLKHFPNSTDGRSPIIKLNATWDKGRYDTYFVQVQEYIRSIKDKLARSNVRREVRQRSGRVDRRRLVDAVILDKEDVFTRWTYKDEGEGKELTVVVLDLSSSIGHVDVVLPQVVLLWECLREYGPLQVYGYNTNDIEGTIEIWDMTPNPDRLHLGGVRVQGMTPTAVGLDMALAHIVTRKPFVTRTRMFHITDGSPTTALAELPAVLKGIREAGVESFHLGVGHYGSGTYLRSTFPDEKFYDVRDYRDLPNVLAKVIEENIVDPVYV